MGLLWGLNAIPFTVLRAGRCSEQLDLTSLIQFHYSHPLPIPIVPQLPAGIFPRGQLHNSPWGLDHPRKPGLLLISGLDFQAALTSQRGSPAPLIRAGLPTSPVRQPQASCKIHHKNSNEMAELCFHVKILITRLLTQASLETG